MRAETFIGLRYLFSRRNKRIISLTSLISVGGVFLGVMALLVTLAVLNGFHDQLKEKILGTMPHLSILSYNDNRITNPDSLIEIIKGLDEVASAAPLVYSEGMIVGQSDQNVGAILRGVDPELENEITDIGSFVYSGSFSFKDESAEDDIYPGLVIGGHMAAVLRVGLGDLVTVWAPRGVKVTPFGVSAPWRKFRITGVFETGLYDADSQFAYMDLKVAQSFFDMPGAVSHIEVRVKDPETAYKTRAGIIEKLGGYPYTGMDWMTYNRNLFEALKLEKMLMFIILTLIILVASFNIISNLSMLVMEKTSEIGILRSMGMTARSVGAIFVVDGLLIGAVGTLLGAVSAYVICWALSKYDFISIPGDVYFLDGFPVNMQAGDFIMVSIASMLITLVATVYPALRASRMSPVEAIRNE